MKYKFLFMAFAFFLLLASPAYSLEIVSFEDVDGKTFYPGDFVDLGTVLINDDNVSVELVVEQYIAYPGIDPMPMYEEVLIEANNDTMISDLSLDVSEYSTPGEYTHVVRVYEAGELITEKITMFYVTGTKERLSDIEVVICADSGCEDVRPVFVLGETAYIMVECLENPEISGYIDRGGIETTTLSFDNGLASFKPASTGTYTANIILSKEGFFTENIEREVTFLEVEEEPVGEITFGYEYVIIVIIIVVILVVIGLFFLRIKGR